MSDVGSLSTAEFRELELEGEKDQTNGYVVHGAKIMCFSNDKVDGDGLPVPNCTRDARLIVPLSHGVYLKKKAQLNIKDCKPMINVQSCGVCISGSAALNEDKEKENAEKEALEEEEESGGGFFGFIKKAAKAVKDTAVAVKDLFFPSEEAKEKEEEIVQESVQDCEPEIINEEEGWQYDGDMDIRLLIEGEQALICTAFLKCQKGGTIRIIDDGQKDE